jgi:hypothetical protein
VTRGREIWRDGRGGRQDERGSDDRVDGARRRLGSRGNEWEAVFLGRATGGERHNVL